MLLTSFLIGFGYLFLLNPIIFTWATLPFMTADAEWLSPSPDGREGCGAPITTVQSATSTTPPCGAIPDERRKAVGAA